MACEWPKVSKKACEATVIFKNDPTIFSRTQGKEFSGENLEIWEQVVRFYRSRKNRDFLNNQSAISAKTLKKLDYIFGPVATDGINPRRNFNPLPGPQNEVHFQFCLKSHDMANDFYNGGKNVHQVIFFGEGPKVSTR